jgi:hypothetical protein
MTTPTTATAHKLGANHKDAAQRSHKRDPNFAQSRDLREDRGERQIKTAHDSQTLRPRFGCK